MNGQLKDPHALLIFPVHASAETIHSGLRATKYNMSIVCTTSLSSGRDVSDPFRFDGQLMTMAVVTADRLATIVDRLTPTNILIVN